MGKKMEPTRILGTMLLPETQTAQDRFLASSVLQNSAQDKDPQVILHNSARKLLSELDDFEKIGKKYFDDLLSKNDHGQPR